MKKITASLLLVAMAIVSLNSCKSNGKSGDGYVLKMRLAKGDKFGQDYAMDMNMNVTMAGMSKDMKVKMNAGTDFEVLDSTAAGKELKITYTKMDMTMDMGMGNNELTDSIMKKTGDRVVGKSVVLTLSGNKVTDVKGFNEIMIGDSADANTKMTMEKMFSKDNFNSMFGMMFSLYPSKPVKEGESWTAENQIDMNGVAMNVNTKYTLLSVKDGIAEIELDGTINSKGTMTQGGTNVEMDMKGTQKGKMEVKVADGYLKSGNYDMDVDAQMGVMGQKVPMKMKANYKLTGK